MAFFRFFVVLVLVCAAPLLSWAQPYDSSYSPPSSHAAAAEIRFQQLEREIRRLTGMIEEQNYEIRRLRAELSKITGDLDIRVKDIERGAGGGKAVSTASPAAFTPPAPANTAPSQQPRTVQTLGTISKSQSSGAVSSLDAAPKAYEHAYSFIKSRDFARAESEFAKFMADFPDHPLVSNAKYWYGETFYVRKDYEKAARIFAEGYQQFPKGPKAASNLLKLGMALSGMGKTDDACIAYKQLKKDYSKSSVPVLKRADTEMKRINCR